MTRRFPIKIVLRAQAHAAAGYTAPQICDLLNREFDLQPGVAKSTVYNWINPDYLRRRQERDRAQKARLRAENDDGSRGSRRHSLARQIARIRRLAAAGVTPGQITIVMQVDYPEQQWTPYRVRMFIPSGRDE